MDDHTSLRSPTPVGSGAVPAALLGAAMTLGLVAAAERTDWHAVAQRVHRVYARAYDTLSTAHRRFRCAAGTAVAGACGVGAWLVAHGSLPGGAGVVSGFAVLALIALVLPGAAHPRYCDLRARSIGLVGPGRAGHGWMFADETTVLWPGGVRPSQAARARRFARRGSVPIRGALLADDD
jgi:hypothetical protein